jgi:hypothetical protein
MWRLVIPFCCTASSSTWLSTARNMLSTSIKSSFGTPITKSTLMAICHHSGLLGVWLITAQTPLCISRCATAIHGWACCWHQELWFLFDSGKTCSHNWCDVFLGLAMGSLRCQPQVALARSCSVQLLTILSLITTLVAMRVLMSWLPAARALVAGVPVILRHSCPGPFVKGPPSCLAWRRMSPWPCLTMPDTCCCLLGQLLL